MVKFKVFVYGTLKQDYYNHYMIAGESTQYIGTGETLTKYPLVVAKGYKFPFMLDKPGDGKVIPGEIYEIDENVLERLDKFEKLYERQKFPYVQRPMASQMRRMYSAGVIYSRTIRQNIWNFPFLTLSKTVTQTRRNGFGLQLDTTSLHMTCTQPILVVPEMLRIIT